ncbi:hypothetical protein GCM10023191_101450 [Actinoallomurus oryzae]|uniref:Uncharacterized protein n=2 Tax=Actinoallomurus oryzae TaxID=502180 RepID=A0ABP8RA87_9ACTN
MVAAVLRKGMTQGRLRTPACAFITLYGVAKLAELLDWSRLHHDVAAMLGAGSGTVTGLLLAGKGAELALTVLAVLALIRASDTLLAAAVAGWTADLAVLTVVAAVCGDLGRLLEHGTAFLVLAALLTVLYKSGAVRLPRRTGAPDQTASPPPHTTRRLPTATADPTQKLPTGTAEPTRQDLPVRRPDVTRQDLPVRRPDSTRRDLPAGGPDPTRQDLPVRRPPTSS